MPIIFEIGRICNSHRVERIAVSPDKYDEIPDLISFLLATLDSSILTLQLVTSVHSHHAAGQVEVFDALETCIDHHLFQLFLSRVHADGFG